MVVENGEFAGLLTPHEIKTVEKRLWGETKVSEVMKPLEQVHTVGPDTPVTDALEILGVRDINQLPVVEDGRLKGVISRDRILQSIMIRQELDVAFPEKGRSI
jgi:CBS domain-containing protein